MSMFLDDIYFPAEGISVPSLDAFFGPSNAFPIPRQPYGHFMRFHIPHPVK
jgi:hypothetical protein